MSQLGSTIDDFPPLAAYTVTSDTRKIGAEVGGFLGQSLLGSCMSCVQSVWCFGNRNLVSTSGRQSRETRIAFMDLVVS